MWIEYGTPLADRMSGDADGLRHYLRMEYGGAATLAQVAPVRRPARRGATRGVLAALMQVLGIVGRRKGR